MAKELAMVERTEVGRRVRRYFIEVENRYREQFGKYGTYLLFGSPVRYVQVDGSGLRYSCLVDVERALRISRYSSVAAGRHLFAKKKLVGARGDVYCVTDELLWSLKQRSKISSIPEQIQMAFA